MSNKCPKCGSGYFGVREDDTCLSCGWHRDTLFDRITASPEVLAPNLVYSWELVFRDDWGNEETEIKWFSTVCDNMAFCDESKAIAATVARLKEVEK